MRREKSGAVTGILGEAALLHAQTERAEHAIRQMMSKIDRAHQQLAERQAKLAKSADDAAYQQAVAEEAAVTAAYRRLDEALGRMALGGATR